MALISIILNIGNIVSAIEDIVGVVGALVAKNTALAEEDGVKLLTVVGNLLSVLPIPGVTASQVSSVISQLIALLGGSNGPSS